MKIKLLRPSSKMPVRATIGSAGYDLFADIDAPIVIPTRKNRKIPLGVAFEIPT